MPGAAVTVCPSGCAFTQVAAAVAVAKDGDTISLAPGTYGGGFTIDKSVKLVGAGAGATIISGGGPVLTIGSAARSGAQRKPATLALKKGNGGSFARPMVGFQPVEIV